MRAKNIIKQAIKDILSPAPEPPPPPPISYLRRKTFDEAADEAGLGYLDPALLKDDAANPDPDLRLLPDFYGPLIAAITIARTAAPDRPLRVLDFGGGKAGAFQIVRAALRLPDSALDWAVVETELYVERASRYPLAGVRFFRSIDDVGRVDFALFSGVLQYLPDWRSPLASATVLAAPHIFVSRTPLAETEAPFLQVVRHPDRTVRYAGRVLPLEAMNRALASTHDRLIGWDLAHHMSEMGITAAPSILWQRRD